MVQIALVQQTPSPDLEANIQRGLAALARAAGEGARLVAFPELAFTPFYPRRPAGRDFLELAEPLDGPLVRRLAC